MVADLQKELPIPGELQNVRVLPSVPGDPDVFFVIDKNPVLEVGPFVAGTRAAPSLNDIPGLIEFEDRWRWNAAYLS